MKPLLLSILLASCSGCGVYLTTSSFKAGLLERRILIQDDNQVVEENLIGLQLQWLPEWTWTDVKRWYNEE